MVPEDNKKGGRQARIGFRFLRDIELIKDKRLRNGKSKERLSTEKITNMITKHESWEKIMEDITESPQEEVDKYGK